MSGTTSDGGPTPTTATMNPMSQQQISYFNQMTPEQLQELVMRLGGTPQGQVAQRVLQQKRTQSAQQPAQQPAQQSAQSQVAPQSSSFLTGMPQTYALGGTLDPKGGVHMTERAIPSGGFLHTAGPGRTDNLNIKPHADSYVLPADVVSGLGEGNSLAGAKALDTAMHTGPHGIPMPSASHAGHRMGAPRPPAAGGGFGGSGNSGGIAALGAFGHAGGGDVKTVPIIAAGGEYVVTPAQCRALGHGDIKRGHAILDAFVLHVRKRTIGEMKSLKGPVKS